MARKKKSGSNQQPIEQYEHKDKQRLNNPPVGLVDSHTDNGGLKKKTYQYDPHLDPQLQWAGKAEHTSFDVPTVSLHVHERIDPRRIIECVQKEKEAPCQISLFETQMKPLREAIEFYKGGKVQMVYLDPPYGLNYGSIFQPFLTNEAR